MKNKIKICLIIIMISLVLITTVKGEYENIQLHSCDSITGITNELSSFEVTENKIEGIAAISILMQPNTTHRSRVWFELNSVISAIQYINISFWIYSTGLDTKGGEIMAISDSGIGYRILGILNIVQSGWYYFNVPLVSGLSEYNFNVSNINMFQINFGADGDSGYIIIDDIRAITATEILETPIQTTNPDIIIAENNLSFISSIVIFLFFIIISIILVLIKRKDYIIITIHLIIMLFGIILSVIYIVPINIYLGIFTAFMIVVAFIANVLSVRV